MDRSGQSKSLVEELVQEMNQPYNQGAPQYNNNFATPSGYPEGSDEQLSMMQNQSGGLPGSGLPGGGQQQPNQQMMQLLQQQQQQQQQQQLLQQQLLQQQLMQQQMQQQQEQGGMNSQNNAGPSYQDDGMDDEYEHPQQRQVDDDIDINTYGITENKSFMDKFLDFFKDPLVVGLLFFLVSLPQVNNLILRFIPFAARNIYYNLGFKTLLMIVLYSLYKFFV